VWQCVCSGEVVERENGFVEVSDRHFLPIVSITCYSAGQPSCCMYELCCGKERSG
jgi:hypothetical protein